MSVLLYGDNKEIIHAIEAIASEKNIKKEVFFDALESAFLQIAKDKFGSGYSFAVRIGRTSGLVEFMRELRVVEKVYNDLTEISLQDAQKIQKGAKLGDTISEDMPTIELNHDILYRVQKEISEVFRKCNSIFHNPIVNEPFCRMVAEGLICGCKEIIGNPNKIGSYLEFKEVGYDEFKKRCENAADIFWSKVC